MTSDRSEIGALLSAYGDGELSPSEMREIEALLAADPGLELRLADQRALAAALRSSLEQEAEGIALDGFADEVMARLPAPATEAPEAPGVTARIGAVLAGLFELPKLRFALGAATVAVVAVLTVPMLLDWREGEILAAAVNGEIHGVDRVNAAPPAAGEPSASVLSVEATGDYETMLYKSSGGTTIIYVREVQ